MNKPTVNWSHGLNETSFFRKDGLLTPLGAPDQRTTVGRNDDGTWFIDIHGPTHARAVMTPEQFLNFLLGSMHALERWGMTIPADWKRWTPPR
jgi:hypothetical protein